MKIHATLLMCWTALIGIGASAQVSTIKKLSETDYARWHKLSSNGLSSDGRWASYVRSYESGADTLFVKCLADGRNHVFPGGSQGRFAGSGTYAVLTEQGTLCLLQLETGQRTQVEGISDFMPLSHGSLFFAESGDGLRLVSGEGRVLWSASGVTGYALSDDGRRLAYGTMAGGSCSAHVVDLGAKITARAPIASGKFPMSVFSWDRSGAAVAFAAVSPDGRSGRRTEQLYRYSVKRARLSQIGARAAGLPEGLQLAPAYTDDLRISDDGTQVFLSLQAGKTEPGEDGSADVEVWNTLDSRLYGTEMLSPSENRLLLAVWTPEKGSIDALSAEAGEYAFLSGDQKFAIICRYGAYEPTTLAATERDIFVRNVATGATKLVLHRFSGMHDRLSVSPSGKYLAYFRDGDWWLYAFSSGTHLRASRKELGNLYDPDFDYPGEAGPAGVPVWADGDAVMLYYDRHDIWKLEIKTQARTRLTRGKESGMAFRLYGSDNSELGRYQKGAAAALSKPLLLYGARLDNTHTGFFSLARGKVDTLAYGPSLYSRLFYSADRNTFAYMVERYDQPRKLLVRNLSGTAPKEVASSNAHQSGYRWGASCIVRYQDNKGRPLQGVLYYPQDYDPSRSYPMVVHVYQHQSEQLHANVNPTVRNSTGFNATVLSAAGYFVLLPDVFLETGNVGNAALDCVTAAVEAAAEMAPVDRGRLGLVGASFGGFETNYIVTHSSLFAAAVAGSSMNDFISGYFSFNRNDSYSEAWRYESDQPRMGLSPFDNWEAYLDNSPIRAAEKLAAPLLLWTGTDDTQVSPQQTEAMYLALRRLGKKGTMLRYKGEGHALVKLENQRDLTLKILEWMDCHLKAKQSPVWLVPR